MDDNIRIVMPDGKKLVLPKSSTEAQRKQAAQGYWASTKGAGAKAQAQAQTPKQGMGMDVLTGVGKGFQSDINTVASLVGKIPGVGSKLMPPERQNRWDKLAEPSNTTQSMAKGAEQIGEFAIPVAGEDRLVAKAGELPGLVAKYGPKAEALVAKYGPKAAKMLASGMQTAGIEKLHGGDAGTGMLAGVAGSGIAQAGEGIGSALMGKAMGGGSKEGKALLEKEVGGITKKQVAKEIVPAIEGVSKDMQKVVSTPRAGTNIGAVRKYLTQALKDAKSTQDKKYVSDVTKLRQKFTYDLTKEDAYGRPMPRGGNAMKSSEAHSILEQIGDKGDPRIKEIKGKIKELLGTEIDKSAPGYKELADKKDTLERVKKFADGTSAPAIGHSASYHTYRALQAAGAAGAGGYGYEHGGLGDALLYGGAVLGAPLLARPAMMEAGKLAAKPVLTNLAKGSILEGARPKKPAAKFGSE